MSTSGRDAASREVGASLAPRRPAAQLLVLAMVVFGAVFGLVIWIHAISVGTAQNGTAQNSAAQNGTAHSSVAATNAMNGMAGMTGMNGRAPVYTSTVVGRARIDVLVKPATVGHNTIALALVDNRTVQRFTAAKQLSVTATLPRKHIGPLNLLVHQTGAGRYTITGANLRTPGLWTLEIAYRTSGLSQPHGTVLVPIH